MRAYLILAGGVLCLSTAVIAIKLSSVHPATLSAARMVVAVGVLAPLFVRAWKRHHATFGWRELSLTILPGLFAGLHFISWNLGARLTVASNATILVTFLPLALPFFLYFLADERLTKAEVRGTLLGIAGVGVLLFGDYQLARENVAGDLVCLGSMLAYAAYVSLGRRNRHFPEIWLFIVPVYAIAGSANLVAALFLDDVAGSVLWQGEELVYALYLGLVPTVMGHTFIATALRHLPGQTVGLFNLTQFVFSALFAYFILSEVPTVAFFPAAALIAAGAVTALRGRKIPRPPGPAKEAARG